MKITSHCHLLTAALIGAISVALSSCDSDTPMVSLGLDSTYRIERMRKLPLRPALTGQKYLWEVDGVAVADTKDYIFLAAEEGTYDVSFTIIDDKTPYHFDLTIEVLHEEIEYSPYISQVFEYRPAPGQFINEMPQYDEGDSEADMVRKAGECISADNDVLISLGGFGGYVTFGFDHTVINRPNAKDLRIWSNSFYELIDSERPGGSAEPGIVMVSYDTNCNGIPDDEWYELVGSDHNLPSTIGNYSITYFRPDPGKVPTPDENNSIADTTYIPWTDSQGDTGFIIKNHFHNQQYWPAWINEPELTFSGTRLASNGCDFYGDCSYYILYSLPWGYVDNHPNDKADLNSFDIDDAVDMRGNRVSLPGIDFVRVYTAVNQSCGWIGETSTEISKAADLSIFK